MKRIEGEYGSFKENHPTIVLSVVPRSGKEVKKLIKMEKKTPGVMVLFYGGKNGQQDN